jgi:hypothetical protein
VISLYHFRPPAPSYPVLHVIERIVAPLGLRVDATSPWEDARLLDGSRVQTRFLDVLFPLWTLLVSTRLLDHSVEMPSVRDAPQLVLAGILERESGAGDKILDGARDENLGRLSARRHTGTDVDRDAPDVVPVELDLAGVKPDAHVDTEIAHRARDGERAPDGPRRPVERRQEPVAKRLDLAPPVPGQRRAHKPVVVCKVLPPGSIAEC